MHCSAVVSLAHSPEAIFQEEILAFFPVRQVQRLPYAPIRGEQDCKLQLKLLQVLLTCFYCMLLIKRDSYHLSGRSQDLNRSNSEQSEI